MLVVEELGAEGAGAVELTAALVGDGVADPTVLLALLNVVSPFGAASELLEVVELVPEPSEVKVAELGLLPSPNAAATRALPIF